MLNDKAEAQRPADALMDVTLDQAACELLFALMHPSWPDSDEYNEVRLQWGDGHSGWGLYASMAEYPEEGAELLVSAAKPAKPDGEPVACPGRPDSRCNYDAHCGRVCNKCGRIHDGYANPNGTITSRGHTAPPAESERIAALETELQQYKAAAPLCEQHRPTGGTRSTCLICACQSLSAALSRISYACEPPNEYECSAYDVHCSETAVVSQVQERIAALEAEKQANYEHWRNAEIDLERHRAALKVAREALEGWRSVDVHSALTEDEADAIKAKDDAALRAIEEVRK